MPCWCATASPRGTPGIGRRTTITLAGMRTMFLIWTGVIVSGLVFFAIVGLTHH
jgi:hypothetical protein